MTKAKAAQTSDLTSHLTTEPRGRPRKAGDEAAMIIAVARGETVHRSAALGGISPRTLQRRMAEPEFRRQVLEARQGMIDAGVGVLAGLGVEAGKTLHRLLKSKSPSVALGAARTILEMGPKWREAGELAQRWTDLEARFDEALAAGKLPETKEPSSSSGGGTPAR